MMLSTSNAFDTHSRVPRRFAHTESSSLCMAMVLGLDLRVDRVDVRFDERDIIYFLFSISSQRFTSISERIGFFIFSLLHENCENDNQQFNRS